MKHYIQDGKRRHLARSVVGKPAGQPNRGYSGMEIACACGYLVCSGTGHCAPKPQFQVLPAFKEWLSCALPEDYTPNLVTPCAPRPDSHFLRTMRSPERFPGKDQTWSATLAPGETLNGITNYGDTPLHVGGVQPQSVFKNNEQGLRPGWVDVYSPYGRSVQFMDSRVRALWSDSENAWSCGMRDFVNLEAAMLEGERLAAERREGWHLRPGCIATYDHTPSGSVVSISGDALYRHRTSCGTWDTTVEHPTAYHAMLAAEGAK